MKYYEIEPEVAGGFGERSIIDTSVHPPIVKRLHILFDGWLGDQLLETFPCFVITHDLASEIQKKALSGFALDDVVIEKSDQFKDLYGEKNLPDFHWFKVIGKPGNTDFGISDQFTLIVSERALGLIRTGLKNCDIKELKRYRDREEPRSSPLPHHAAYGSVLRGSADQAESDPGGRKTE